MPKLLKYARAGALVCLLVYWGSVLYELIERRHQPALFVYYFTSRLYAAGTNPYYGRSITYPDGSSFNFVYQYPPITLPLIKPFASIPFDTLFAAWLSVKVLAMVSLLIFWQRHFVADASYGVLMLIVCTFGFMSTGKVDIWNGNVSTFEQLLLWPAVWCLLRRRPYWYAFLVVLLSQMKIVTIALLPICLIDWNRKAFCAVLAGGAAFVAVNLASYLATPELYRGFLYNGVILNERWPFSPSCFPLFKDIFDGLRQRAGIDVPHGAIVVYVLYAGLMVAAGIATLVRHRGTYTREDAVFLCILLYAVAAPRLMRYSYILIVIPTVHVLRNALRSTATRAAAVAFICTSLFPYQSWLAAVGLYATLMRHLRQQADGHTPAEDAPLPSDAPVTS